MQLICRGHSNRIFNWESNLLLTAFPVKILLDHPLALRNFVTLRHISQLKFLNRDNITEGESHEEQEEYTDPEVKKLPTSL